MFIIEIDKMGKLLKKIVWIGMLLAIPCIVGIPFILKHNSNMIYSMLIVYPNGCMMLKIAYEFYKMFDSLEKKQPFTIQNVNLLRKTGCLSYGMSVLWIIDLGILIFLIKNTYIDYIIILIFLSILFFGVGIALWTLSLLLQQATEYKEENDLTI